MDFLELNKNEFYKVRCVKNPWQYFCHPELVYAGKNEHTSKVKCALLKGDAQCAICSHFGNKPESRWLLTVLNWRNSRLALIDIGIEIFNSIREYAKDPSWGDPINYDITFFYSEDRNWQIKPSAAKKLTHIENHWIEADYNDYYMQFLVNPPTFEQTAELIQYQDYKRIK